jgi:hypothetical protein
MPTAPRRRGPRPTPARRGERGGRGRDVRRPRHRRRGAGRTCGDAARRPFGSGATGAPHVGGVGPRVGPRWTVGVTSVLVCRGSHSPLSVRNFAEPPRAWVGHGADHEPSRTPGEGGEERDGIRRDPLSWGQVGLVRAVTHASCGDAPEPEEIPQRSGRSHRAPVRAGPRPTLLP